LARWDKPAARDIAYLISLGRASHRGWGHLKLEIDDLERRAIERSLVERRSRLIEKAGDTTLTPARRQASYRELSANASALRKLRRQIRSAKSHAWVARRTTSPVAAMVAPRQLTSS
jgi:hypothetical protein